MNSIDFRNLQEAYSNVYENEQLDEISADLALAASKKADIARGKAAAAGDKGKAVEKMQQASRLYAAQAKKRLNREQMGDEESQMGGSDTTALPPVDKKKEMLAKQQLANLRTIQQKKQQLERQKLNLQKQSKLPLNSEEFESYDLFDYMMEYLIDEGYADTNENALVIMANMSEEWKEDILNEATAMAKRGLNEPAIRQQIASKTGGGSFADKATKLADRETYGNKGMKAGRENLARKQRGDFRNTTSSKPGLQGYGHKATTDADKEKQSARGSQRGVLTPNEKKQLGR